MKATEYILQNYHRQRMYKGHIPDNIFDEV
jgi:hypothetical protein